VSDSRKSVAVVPSAAERWLVEAVVPGGLASLAAAGTLVLTYPDGTRHLHFGVEAVGVVLCLTMVVWRRNLLLGLIVGVGFVVAARAMGFGLA